jgi:hypothetical protein
MDKYEVGNVVYILDDKTLKIASAVIIEEITRKKINETETEYTLYFSDDTKKFLSGIEEKVFTDIEKLRQFMIDNTKKTIEKLLSNDKSESELLTSKLELGPKKPEKYVQNSIKDVIMNSDNTKNTNQQEET